MLDDPDPLKPDSVIDEFITILSKHGSRSEQAEEYMKRYEDDLIIGSLESVHEIMELHEEGLM